MDGTCCQWRCCQVTFWYVPCVGLYRRQCVPRSAACGACAAHAAHRGTKVSHAALLRGLAKQTRTGTLRFHCIIIWVGRGARGRRPAPRAPRPRPKPAPRAPRPRAPPSHGYPARLAGYPENYRCNEVSSLRLRQCRLGDSVGFMPAI